MSKTARKSASKTPRKKAARDLEVKPAKGGAVRGGCDGSSKDPALRTTVS